MLARHGSLNTHLTFRYVALTEKNITSTAPWYQVYHCTMVLVPGTMRSYKTLIIHAIIPVLNVVLRDSNWLSTTRCRYHYRNRVTRYMISNNIGNETNNTGTVPCYGQTRSNNHQAKYHITPASLSFKLTNKIIYNRDPKNLLGLALILYSISSLFTDPFTWYFFEYSTQIKDT